jgi:hypothetical protein
VLSEARTVAVGWAGRCWVAWGCLVVAGRAVWGGHGVSVRGELARAEASWGGKSGCHVGALTSEVHSLASLASSNFSATVERPTFLLSARRNAAVMAFSRARSSYSVAT